MAFTYDITQLATSELFQVRFNIGDTDSNVPLLQDEEINYKLSIATSVIAASIQCCMSIAAQFSSSADYILGPHAVKASQRARQYRALADQLKADSIDSNGIPASTGPLVHRVIFDIDMMNAAPGNHNTEED